MECRLIQTLNYIPVNQLCTVTVCIDFLQVEEL